MEVCTSTYIPASSLEQEEIDHKIQWPTLDARVTAAKLTNSKDIVKKEINCIAQCWILSIHCNM